MKPTKLNLACGNRHRDGFWNVDSAPGCRPDEIADVLEPAWWDAQPDDTYEEVVIEHFLEHIPHQIPDRHGWGSVIRIEQDGLIWFLEHVYRVLKPGGKLEVAIPHHQCHAAYSDPTHCRFLTQHTFGYFDAVLRRRRGHGHYQIQTDLELLTDMQLGFLDHVQVKTLTAGNVDEIMRDHWNVAWEERHWMIARKPPRE